MTMSASKPLKLLLLRHGQTRANAQGQFLGIRDVPLNQLGHQQAQNLVALLANETITTIYSSPLQRALQTALPLANSHQLTVLQDERLIEQDYGAWDGLNYADIKKHHSQDFNRWRHSGDIPPTDGESLPAVAVRINGFLDELRAIPGGQTVAITGHASALQVLLCSLFGVKMRSRWPFKLENGTLTEVLLIENQPTLTKLNLC